MLKIFLSLIILTSCASSKKVTKKEKKAKILYSRGTANLMGRSYTSALRDLIAANKLSPKDKSILNNLGMAYYFKKEKTKAKFYISKSIEIDKINSEARGNLASIYLQEKKYNRAEKQYKIILKDLLYHHQYKTYYNLGILKLKQQHKAQAMVYFNKSLEENSQHCPSLFQVALDSYNKGFYKTSYAKFKQASMGICVNSPAPHYYQALSLVELRDKVKAKLKLEYLIEQFPKSKFATLAQIKISTIKNMKSIHRTETVRDWRVPGNARKKISPNF
jgi:type IV pilus assembly protein PilF